MAAELPPLERLEQLSTADQEIEDTLAGRVLDKLPDPLIVVDAAGLIRLCNEEAELFFGRPRQSLIGRPVEILLPEDARERHVAEREEFGLNPRVRPMGVPGLQLSALHRDGRVIPDLEIHLAPVVVRDGLYTAAVIRRAPRQ